jgi:tetratricopeptide (TPR) repeat protein
MRAAVLCVLLAGCKAGLRDPGDARGIYSVARGAEAKPDWPVTRTALRNAALLAPNDAEINLHYASCLLLAYGEVKSARRIYGDMLGRSRARALHGLGWCALVEGDEERALELWKESLGVQQTVDCSHDTAVLLLDLGREDEAQKALELVERISRQSVRTQMLLAAAGRREAPPGLPEGWHFALDRARVRATSKQPESAAADLREHLEKAYFTDLAREFGLRRLQNDFALRRNPQALAEVIK